MKLSQTSNMKYIYFVFKTKICVFIKNSLQKSDVYVFPSFLNFPAFSDRRRKEKRRARKKTPAHINAFGIISHSLAFFTSRKIKISKLFSTKHLFYMQDRAPHDPEASGVERKRTEKKKFHVFFFLLTTSHFLWIFAILFFFLDITERKSSKHVIVHNVLPSAEKKNSTPGFLIFFLDGGVK